MSKGLCPQCRETTVVRVKPRGTFPTCGKCKDINRLGRLERQRTRRKKGLIRTHLDKDGRRYSDNATERKTVCKLCRRKFVSDKKRSKHGDVCPSCTDPHAEKMRQAKTDRVIRDYHKDPQKVKRQRLARTLERAGLSIDWYDRQPKICGICKSPEPGSKGWHIDHDHSCCPAGIRAGCANCIRGLLCNRCNLGLGHFEDDVARLKAAVRWLEKHRRKRSRNDPKAVPA